MGTRALKGILTSVTEPNPPLVNRIPLVSPCPPSIMVLTHTSSKKARSVVPLRRQPRRKVSSKSSAPSSACTRAPPTIDPKSAGKKPREPSKPLAVAVQPRSASKCLTSPERLIRMTGARERWEQFQNDRFVVLFDQIVARCALCKEDFVLCERSEYDWLHWQGHLRRCMNGTAGRQRTSKKSEAWLRAFKKKADARLKELDMSHTVSSSLPDILLHLTDPLYLARPSVAFTPGRS
ncbi:hypothetical protein C8Q74DRAFT_577599 [Fomes fomentarius]|nr:hypothetical protein C8Q74DRAFT_577599 [Fomes fomentarius]